MLRPSRPMILPFMSSDGSSITVTVVSAAWLAATRCSASATRLRARRFDSARASSSSMPHAPRELVPDELLPTLEQVRLRLLERHAGDPLELRLLRRLRLLQLLLELAEVRLAVGEPLVLARELDELPLDLLLLREHALLDLQHRLAAVGELGVDLGAKLDGLLPRLDLRLAAQRLGFALGVLDQLARIRRALPTPVAPKTCTATNASATPTAIPMTTPMTI